MAGWCIDRIDSWAWAGHCCMWIDHIFCIILYGVDVGMHKYIYWRPELKSKSSPGKMFANVHVLVGYNQCSITDIQEMADELRKTFPEATDSEITCGKVTKSRCVQGFTIIAWNMSIDKKKYPGWMELKQLEYSV